MKTISEHLQYMLEKLNEQHPGIKRVNADESVQRVGRVIDNLNSKMSQMDVEINGQDFEKDKIPQIHNPFKSLVWVVISPN